MDMDGYRCEAAWEAGAVTDDDCEIYTFTTAQLIAFAKMCERAGRAQAAKLFPGLPVIAQWIDATDEQIAAEIAR